MKLIIPAVAYLSKSVVCQTQEEINNGIAENVISEYCHQPDPVTGAYTNLMSDDLCIEYRPNLNNGQAVVVPPSARKLKQLKMLVLWLQPEHRFARYCYYGCWCLPDEDHKDYTPRYGKPVDNIDSSCKRQAQCYDCAKMEFGDECESSDVGYKYALHSDPNDPDNHWKNSISCLDDPKKKGKACKRAVCECDKRLSEELRENFGFWVQGHHQTQGDFDTAECQIEHCTGPNCQNRGPLECCGYNNGPRYPFRTHDGQRKCCGDKTYDSTIQECCSPGDVRFSGAC